ncbi:hypothetical protein N7537_008943 [Penicillium hordei]|uniref:Uncharacterized protein n=1 Tax=Penicillium hordei TaxID=40994 RepID=A0AAD6E1X9_9EURO|nr:uncharacterized protein N7537_008943 [Penicillium hordei]KAJ5598859.1 hypothetical protein N7537_008943 [Penicillium hordei]
MPARFLKSKQSPVLSSAQVDVGSISPASFKLSQAGIEESIAECPAQTMEDIKTVQDNVRGFAQAQKDSLSDFEFESQPGVILGQKNLPVNMVGA